MSKYYRTYINKVNTLVSDNEANTGLNPVAEIWYGYNELSDDISYSRMLVDFDESEIQSLYDEHDLTNNSTVKHKLVFYNTNYNTHKQIGSFRGDGKRRAQDFTLQLFDITEDWYEGVGFNFPFPLNEAFFTPKLSNTIKEPSNWYKRNNLNSWFSGGALERPCIVWGDTGTTFTQISGLTFYQTCQPVLGEQYFEYGNENLEIDITDYVNDRLYGTGRTTHGLMVRFSDDYEFLSGNPFFSVVLFYTNKADSFYVPFIETTWESNIKDRRTNFVLDQTNPLYLFTSQNGKLIKPDSPPSAVTITDYQGDIIQSFTGDSIVNVSKGVYKIDLHLESCDHYSDTVYQDTWSGVIINGKKKTYSNNFQLIEEKDNFIESYTKDYFYSVKGIHKGEKIYRGEKRKIIIKAFENNYSLKRKSTVEPDLKYRVYIREGQVELDIIPFSDMDIINGSYIIDLDTSWLIPNRYYIDFVVNSEGTHGLRKELFYFDVITTKEKYQI